MKNVSYLLFILALLALPIFSSLNVRAADYSVTTTNASGVGSFLQAVTDANANPGLDNITFDIAGAGPFVIDQSANPFVIISDALTINGLSQPGSNTATPLINIKNTTLLNQNSVSSMSFSGLILENTTLSTFTPNITANNNRFNSTPSGSLRVKDSTSGNISDNTFTNGSGLGLENSSNLTINNNILTNTSFGVNFTSGISNNNTISNNTFTGGANGAGFNNGLNNTISNNTFTGTSFAVNLNLGSSNTVSNNSFSGTSWPINNRNINNQFNLFTQNNLTNTFWDIQNFNSSNQNINPPVIESVETVGTNIVITGYAKPGSRIEIYRAIPIGSNLTSTYVATLNEGSASDTNTTTGPNDSNSLATARFTFTIAIPANYANGTGIRVTATDSTNNTSQFSNKVNYTATTANLTTINIVSSANPAIVGTSVIFTATLVSVDALTGTTVEFFDGLTSLGTSTITNNIATFTTSSLAIGNHDIRAVYIGNNNTIESMVAQVISPAINPIPTNNSTGGTTIILNKPTQAIQTPNIATVQVAASPVAKAESSTAQALAANTKNESPILNFETQADNNLIRTGGTTNQKPGIGLLFLMMSIMFYLVVKSNKTQESK